MMRKYRLLVFWLSIKRRWFLFWFPIKCKLKGDKLLSKSCTIVVPCHLIHKGMEGGLDFKPYLSYNCWTQEMIDDVRNMKGFDYEEYDRQMALFQLEDIKRKIGKLNGLDKIQKFEQDGILDIQNNISPEIQKRMIKISNDYQKRIDDYGKKRHEN